MRDNARVLLAGYRSIAETVREQGEITPSAEWILDNFYVVEQQIREIHDHLPGNYYRHLPKIVDGHLAGYPRVYGLAWAYVAHTDSRFELETLRRFVCAYQRVQLLTIGELWAVTIKLRVALVENLRRLSQLVVRSRQQRAAADELADRLLGLSSGPAESVEDILRGLGDAPLERPFAVQLVQRLRDQGPAMLSALAWLNKKLHAQGAAADEMVIEEHQAQASASVTVRNIITSMRWMSSIDWRDFFESVSPVDEIMRAAPGFAASDFVTRDEYRAQIELLARRSERSEVEVARESVLMAASAAQDAAPATDAAPDTAASAPRRDDIAARAEEDPGFYLLSHGRLRLEKRLGFRVPLRIRLRRFCRARAIIGYTGTIAASTALLLSAFLWQSWAAGATIPVLLLLGILGWIPVSEITVSLVDRLVPMLVPPKLLPKLDLSLGVPAEHRTLVVVPMLLTALEDVDEQVERLEVHYLANPDGHLQFALLSDWADAPAEHMPGDEDLVNALAAGIARLNEKYEGPSANERRFLVLHRRRLWNEQQGMWMGWERKRGKLHELNRLLRGATDTTFIPVRQRALTVPRKVRFVITLDADTRLPRASAYRLVGTAAHPLNRPRFDPRERRVTAGLGSRWCSASRSPSPRAEGSSYLAESTLRPPPSGCEHRGESSRVGYPACCRSARTSHCRESVRGDRRQSGRAASCFRGR